MDHALCVYGTIEREMKPQLVSGSKKSFTFLGNKAFYSIDLYGDELAQPIENLKAIYRLAKKEGLRLKAHVGEWGLVLC